MRKYLALAVIGLGAVALWFGIWHQLMAADVARVKASLSYHYEAIKARHPHVTLKADEVYATGFPFGFRVAITRPTLTQIQGDVSYAVSLPSVELQKTDTAQGRYRVVLPASFDAMFAQAGHAPESYRITLNEVPAVLLRAQGDSRHCPDLPGSKSCPAVADDAPLVSFAAQLPSRLVLDVALNGQSKQIGFTLMPLQIPLFMEIPADMDRPLQIFVGMLREAMIYNTPTR